MAINVFGSGEDDVWDGVFEEVFFGEIPVIPAPDPYRPGRVKRADENRSRVKQADNLRSRPESATH